MTKVLVIGAGPAGCAAAIESARSGAQVVLVDRAAFPRHKTCGDAVSNEAARIIDALGAGDHFRRAPKTRVAGAVAILPDGDRIARTYGDDPGFIVPRYDLDNCLRLAAGDAGVEVLEQTNIRRLVTHAGRVVGAEGDGYSWTGDTVIAADGPGSIAWTALGLDKPSASSMGVAITAYYRDVADGPDAEYSEHFFEPYLPCGYAWIFPAIDGLRNVGVYQRLDRFQAQKGRLRSLLSDFIARQSHRFAGARLEGKSRVWSLPLASRRPPAAVEGLLTCGDAASLIDPLTGEGIWQALESGRIAGRIAASGRVTRRRALRYRVECAREVGWPSAVRVAIQRAMEELVERGWYRRQTTKRLLRWGYTRRALEFSKNVSHF